LQEIFNNLFPFSKNAAEHLKTLEIDIRTLPDEFPTSFNEAFKRIQTLLEANTIPDKVDTSPTSPEVIVYAIMRIFIELSDFDILRNRFAEAYSKRTEKLLLAYPDTNFLEKLALETFNWNLKKEEGISTRKFHWKLQFYNFLEAAPSLMAKEWKLINHEMNKGWVFLTKEKLIRLIAEKSKLYILSRRIPKSEIPKLPGTYNPFLEQLKTKISQIQKKFGFTKIYPPEIVRSAYPPCISYVLEKAKRGENLAHTERLFITFFLLNIGHSVSEVVSVFKNQPDFRDDKTRYQVEFAAGMRGGGTKYTSFGCLKLKSFGICKSELDPWCTEGLLFLKKPFKNPLSYYRAKIFLFDHKKTDNLKEEAKNHL